MQVDPPCKYVLPAGEGCGGCKLQELAYSAQLRIKQEQVSKVVTRRTEEVVANGTGSQNGAGACMLGMAEKGCAVGGDRSPGVGR